MLRKEDREIDLTTFKALQEQSREDLHSLPSRYRLAYLPPDNAPNEAPLGTAQGTTKEPNPLSKAPSSTADASVGDPTTTGDCGMPGPDSGYDLATTGGLPGLPVGHIQAAPVA